jgi:7-cyano-7-deazaguanine synthase
MPSTTAAIRTAGPNSSAGFEALAALATKAGVEGARFTVHAPLIAMSKAQIIQSGIRLGVDYAMTVSCYQADAAGRACGRCDSCRLRREGFDAAGIADPTAISEGRSRCAGIGPFRYHARPFAQRSAGR